MKPAADDRFPRGAILVVALGLLVTVAVAWASDENLVSSKALPWAISEPGALPGTGPVALGSDGSLRLSSSGIDSTEPNSEGARLFQVGGEIIVRPPAGSRLTRVSCRADTDPPTVNARTPNRPAAYPGPTGELHEAPWPGDVPINHSEQGSPYSTVTLPIAYQGYGGEPGIEVDWGDWQTGSQEWIWTLTPERERADAPARLRFVSLWRTIERPAITIRCRAESGGARAAASIAGNLAAAGNPAAAGGLSG
ncbi:MAG TPA: hypothetical protein VFC52_05390 [Solirubrobacterales bacterium]|nr:hypothetical protein [Solirubrobacterales bacterium]